MKSRSLKLTLNALLILVICGAFVLIQAPVDRLSRQIFTFAIAGSAEAYTADFVVDGINDHEEWQAALGPTISELK